MHFPVCRRRKYKIRNAKQVVAHLGLAVELHETKTRVENESCHDRTLAWRRDGTCGAESLARPPRWDCSGLKYVDALLYADCTALFI